MAVALSGLLSIEAHALYRCGNVYSQTPCEPQASERAVFQDRNPNTAETGRLGQKLCEEQSLASLGLQRGPGAQAQSSPQPTFDTLPWKGDVVPVRVYTVTVNVRDARQTPIDRVRFACKVNVTESTVLQLQER